jgi:rieske iron-sulfur protein
MCTDQARGTRHDHELTVQLVQTSSTSPVTGARIAAMSMLNERRMLVKGALGLVVGASVLPCAAQAQQDAASIRPKEGDLLVRIGDSAAMPLTPNDVPVGGAPTMAWAMDAGDKTIRSGSRLNRVLLVRLDPEKCSAETRSRAADGVVAYTAICTHTGCDVTDWLADEQMLSCPCHFSKFDPKDGARVVDGPAPRTLPALPLKLEDGKLLVAAAFTSRVGFESA